jgi:hypothetical protein
MSAPVGEAAGETSRGKGEGEGVSDAREAAGPQGATKAALCASRAAVPAAEPLMSRVAAGAAGRTKGML